MTETERQQLVALMDALTELAAGCAHQCGMDTVAKVVQASQVLKITLLRNAKKQTQP